MLKIEEFRQTRGGISVTAGVSVGSAKYLKNF